MLLIALQLFSGSSQVFKRHMLSVNIKLPIFRSFTIKQKLYIGNFVCESKQCLDSGNLYGI